MLYYAYSKAYMQQLTLHILKIDEIEIYNIYNIHDWSFTKIKQNFIT